MASLDDELRTDYYRWVLAVASFLIGIYATIWVYLEARLDCMHVGTRPENLCADWWYENHAWAAAALAGVAAFTLSILMPVVFAPSHKRPVGLLTLSGTVSFVILTFESPLRWWLASFCIVTTSLVAATHAVKKSGNEISG